MKNVLRLLVLTVCIVGFAACGGGEEAGEESPSDLAVVVEPPKEVIAGQTFDVAFELTDENQRRAEVEGVEVNAVLNHSQFADGSDAAMQQTNAQGVAEFELVIEQAFTGLVLTATADHSELAGASTNTDLFDVVAADVDAGGSFISGDDGTDADGVDSATIIIELVDGYANPVAGVIPQFQASGQGNEYGECTATGIHGVATCSMTSSEPGEKTLEITAPVEVTGETINFLLPCDRGGAPFGGGDGSDGDPHRICSAHQLNTIGDGTTYLGDAFVVTRDIDMSGIDNFNIIGFSDDLPDASLRFSGRFDGGGYVIEHLSIDGDFSFPVGMFGFVNDGAVIENVGLEEVEMNVDVSTLGGLVGMSYGKISNSYVTGGIQGIATVGGLVGRTGSQGSIIDSHSTASVDGSYLTVGGLVGNNAVEVTNSYATGDVDGQEVVGGLIGSNNGPVSGSYATGDASAIAWKVGGLIGRNYADITDSYALGNVDGAKRIGGFVGNNSGDINNSYSTGYVVGQEYDGGFLGQNSAEIDGSYWDEDTSKRDRAVGDGSDDGITGLSTGEFGDESNFEGWDFADIWMLHTAPDGEQRPILQWQEQ